VRVASFEGAARKRGYTHTALSPAAQTRIGTPRGGPAAEVVRVLEFTAQASAVVEPDLRAGFVARAGTQRARLVRRSLGEVGRSRSTSDTVHLNGARTHDLMRRLTHLL